MPVEAATRILAEFRVGERDAGLRLDRFLKTRIPKLSRTRIQEAIRDRVETPGRDRPRPGLRLREGDLVRVREAMVEEPPFPPELEPRLLHLDPDLIAVDKPAGLPVHATRRTVRNQLVRWLRDRFGEQVALAHRLDRETSGIVVSTRSPAAARTLALDFASGRVDKEYLAVVIGTPPEAFEVDLPVGPDRRSAVFIKQAAGAADGAPAFTRFRLERALPERGLALVRAFPRTGRRHQIRVHLAAAGFPVLGDKLYARGERHFLNFAARGLTPAMLGELGAARHMLHAARLALVHPTCGEPLVLEAPLPADFVALLAGGS